jgi:aquaporin Z
MFKVSLGLTYTLLSLILYGVWGLVSKLATNYIDAKSALVYQTIAGLIYLIATGKPGFTLSGANPLATNGYGVHSPGGYSLFSCFIAEVVLTFIFLIVILGATDGRAPKGFAPIAIGLALTLIHLISIPITNTSVNPARSTGPALFAGVSMFKQVWLFWVAPILGAILAGLFYSKVLGESGAQVAGEVGGRKLS